MGLSQDEWANIIKGSFDIGGGILNGVGQAQMSQAQMQAQAERDRAQAAQNQFTQQQGQAQSGLASTQMDPMAKAKAEQQAAFRNAMMSGMKNGQFSLPTGGFDAQTMAPYGQDNQLASEKNFYQNVANTSPNSPTPDLSLLYGDKGTAAMGDINTTQQAAKDRTTQEQDAVAAALNRAGGGDAGAAGATAGGLTALLGPTAARVALAKLTAAPSAAGALPAGAPGAGATTAMPTPGVPGNPPSVPTLGGAPNAPGGGDIPGYWRTADGRYIPIPGDPANGGGYGGGWFPNSTGSNDADNPRQAHD